MTRDEPMDISLGTLPRQGLAPSSGSQICYNVSPRSRWPPLGTVCLRRKTGPRDSEANISDQTQTCLPTYPSVMCGQDIPFFQ